jgi:hypothetical protein
MAFSPLPLHLQQPHNTTTQTQTQPSTDRVEADTPRTQGRRLAAEQAAAEEERVTRLEQEWRAPTEERYFGATAQLAAARRLTARQPTNVAAWLRVAHLLFQVRNPVYLICRQCVPRHVSGTFEKKTVERCLGEMGAGGVRQRHAVALALLMHMHLLLTHTQ